MFVSTARARDMSLVWSLCHRLTQLGARNFCERFVVVQAPRNGGLFPPRHSGHGFTRYNISALLCTARVPPLGGVAHATQTRRARTCAPALKTCSMPPLLPSLASHVCSTPLAAPLWRCLVAHHAQAHRSTCARKSASRSSGVRRGDTLPQLLLLDAARKRRGCAVASWSSMVCVPAGLGLLLALSMWERGWESAMLVGCAARVLVRASPLIALALRRAFRSSLGSAARAGCACCVLWGVGALGVVARGEL